MSTVKNIKICGITNKEDAIDAAKNGATHIGLIFVQSSPRKATTEAAREIVEAIAKKSFVTGVFQNQSTDEICDIVRSAGLDIVQLHGDESDAYCAELARQLNKPVIKTIIIDRAESADSLQQKISSYRSVQYLLFDRAKSDKNPDWLPLAIAKIEALEKTNNGTMPAYFFAGGLTPDNIESVLKSINPAGVDVASGVEAMPGKKDPALVQKFIQSVQSKAKEQK